MRFYSINYCDYAGHDRDELFRNKKDAEKRLKELREEEDDAGCAYLSDVRSHDLEKFNKDSIIKLFNEISR